MSTIALTRILVPTDFSDPSDAALKYGVALADAFAGQLHLLHVLDASVERMFAAQDVMMASHDVAAGDQARAGEALSALLTRLEREQYRVVHTVVRGAPRAAIVDYARREAIDLIVMGTHGRGAMAHLLIGSVAENVVRTAPCPVLTVPLRGHDFVKP